MDDLLREFLVETGENLDTVDARLVQLEHEPNNQDILRAIFRLVHTIKGTCGFLGLPRLEALTHAAETVMGHFRDGAPVTRAAVTLILSSIDRIKTILGGLERDSVEPAGDDGDLIAALDAMAMQIAGVAPERGEPSAFDFDAMPSDEPVRDEAAPESAAAAATLRVNMDTLERLMTMVSELVLTRNQLMEVSRQTQAHSFGAPLQRLSLVTGELQDCVMKTRMQPISHACQKLPRLVRDLCLELGKDIQLTVIGGETELDRQVLDLIKDPLTHLVRNAADHGIEKPDMRRAAGKPPRGVITIAARHSGGALVLTIADDGRGLDLPRIRAKALERKLASEAELERMSDAQAARMIFHPGFSTAETISAISGRGVGMDVVAANVGQAGGHVDVRSNPDTGTIFTITLPLTLAILPALLIGVKDQRFALPQSVIAELVRIGPDSDARIARMDHGAMLTLRGEVFPLLSLSVILGLASGAAAFEAHSGFVALLAIEDKRFALLIDTVLHTEEIVVKPISSALRHLQLYSGCTILGDGSVVLIFEPNALARMVGGAPATLQFASAPETAAMQARAMPVIVVRAGARRLAVPLSMITRIERLAPQQIERSGAQAMIQHGGALLPVLRLDGMAAPPPQADSVCLLVDYRDRKAGLLADEIIDVVEADIELSCDSTESGVLGAAIVQGQATDMVDVVAFLLQAFPGIADARASLSHHEKLLLIEPCPFIRDMLAPVLRAARFDVTLDDDPRHAMQTIGAFGLIVFDLDVMTDAYPDLLPQFLAARAPRSAVMALSSAIDPVRAERLAREGVNAVISKFDRRGLIEALRAALPMPEMAA